MKSSLIETVPRYEGLRVTREQYLDLPEDGNKYDMIEGVLHVVPSPFYVHGNVQAKFIYRLSSYLNQHPIGEVAAEIDVLLPDEGDVLRPDINFILNERKNIIFQHIHGAPDLVCEILSEKTARRDLGVKADRYLHCGVQEYWIADPRDKSLQVWYNEENSLWQKNITEIAKFAEELQSKLLPGFYVRVADIFR